MKLKKTKTVITDITVMNISIDNAVQFIPIIRILPG